MNPCDKVCTIYKPNMLQQSSSKQTAICKQFNSEQLTVREARGKVECSNLMRNRCRVQQSRGRVTSRAERSTACEDSYQWVTSV